MSQTRFINPDALSKPPGYSHVVEASAPGRIVYIAGQLGVDREGGKVVGDFRQQAIQTFGISKPHSPPSYFRQVVKLNNYLVDVGDLPTFREVRDSYLPTGDRPASTTIAISVSRARSARLEIEAVAMLPAARSKSASKAASSARRRGRKRRAATRPRDRDER